MTPITRTLIVALVASLLMVAFGTDAQQAQKIPKVGYLAGGSPGSAAPFIEAFEAGLRDLGWVKGQNVAIEYRFAEGKAEWYPDLAAELLRMNVDLIVAPGPPARAVRDATSTIPVVFLLGADPVAFGLVDSFERPGRNLTGTMENNPELTAMRLRLLKEAAPSVTRVGILWQPGTLPEAKFQDVLKNAHAAASTLEVQLHTFEARDPGQFEKALADMAGAQVNGLIVMQSPMFVAQRQAIIDLVAQNNLPAIYEWGVYADAGGLISYGANLLDEYRRAAPYVVKILKGAKPADLPIEQPTKFELVINMKTAKALGIKIPGSVLVQATKVIE
jgi:putative tryptophan/tyrosine transport system substrate-binding protein